MKEFNLSEKIEQTHFNDNIDMLKAEDVKEFIKLLKQRIGGLIDVNEEIDKLAGDDLI